MSLLASLTAYLVVLRRSRWQLTASMWRRHHCLLAQWMGVRTPGVACDFICVLLLLPLSVQLGARSAASTLANRALACALLADPIDMHVNGVASSPGGSACACICVQSLSDSMLLLLLGVQLGAALLANRIGHALPGPRYWHCG